MFRRQFLQSFARLCVSNASGTELPLLLPHSVRTICKDTVLEPGWKAIGYRWKVQFPEKYTIKKLPLMKLGGRDPETGNFIFK